MRKETEGAEYGEDVDVVVAKSHPKPNAVRVDVLGQRVQFVVPIQIDGARTNYREVVSAFDGMRRILSPLAVRSRSKP